MEGCLAGKCHAEIILQEVVLNSYNKRNKRIAVVTILCFHVRDFM